MLRRCRIFCRTQNPPQKNAGCLKLLEGNAAVRQAALGRWMRRIAEFGTRRLSPSAAAPGPRRRRHRHGGGGATQASRRSRYGDARRWRAPPVARGPGRHWRRQRRRRWPAAVIPQGCCATSCSPGEGASVQHRRTLEAGYEPAQALKGACGVRRGVSSQPCATRPAMCASAASTWSIRIRHRSPSASRARAVSMATNSPLISST